MHRRQQQRQNGHSVLLAVDAPPVGGRVAARNLGVRDPKRKYGDHKHPDIGNGRPHRFGFVHVDQYHRQDDHRNRRRDQGVPGKTHELVEPRAEQRPANPHEKEDEGHHLAEHDEELTHHGQRMVRVVEPVQPAPVEPVAEREQLPPAEEERGHEGTDREQVGILAQEEHGHLHRAVFGVEAADEFLFRLGQVKRRAIRLCKRGRQEDQERQRVEQHIPSVPICVETMLSSRISPVVSTMTRTASPMGIS